MPGGPSKSCTCMPPRCRERKPLPVDSRSLYFPSVPEHSTWLETQGRFLALRTLVGSVGQDELPPTFHLSPSLVSDQPGITVRNRIGSPTLRASRSFGQNVRLDQAVALFAAAGEQASGLVIHHTTTDPDLFVHPAGTNRNHARPHLDSKELRNHLP